MKKQPKAKLHPDEYLLSDDNNGYRCPKQDKFVEKIIEKRDPKNLNLLKSKRKK